MTQAKGIKKDEVRNFIKSAGGITFVAEKLGVEPNTVNIWCYNNRIPENRVVELANLSGWNPLTVQDMAILRRKTIPRYPKATLQTMLKVKNGEMRLVDAYQELGLTKASAEKIYALNEDRLEKMIEVMEQYRTNRVTAAEAGALLDIPRVEFHRLARQYGYDRLELPPKPPSAASLKKKEQHEIALRVIAGHMLLKDSASERTTHRYVKRLLDPLTLSNISHWLPPLRQALAEEIKGRDRGLLLRIFEYVEEQDLRLFKVPPSRPRPDYGISDYRTEELRPIAMSILRGDETLAEVAGKRGGEVAPLARRLDGVLAPFGLSFDEATNLTLAHQAALATVLYALEAKEKRPTNVTYPRQILEFLPALRELRLKWLQPNDGNVATNDRSRETEPGE